MFKKMCALILSVIIVTAFCAVSVSGDTNRFSLGFMEDAIPGSLTESCMSVVEDELVGTWVLESVLKKAHNMNKREISSMNTLHLLRNGEITSRYNNGPVVKKYDVKYGKLVVFTFLRSEFNNGEAENSKNYYSILNDNGVYKLVSETGNIYVRISTNENADLADAI